MMKIYDKKLAYPYFIWMVLFTVVPLIIVVYYALTDGNGNFTIADLTSVSGYGSVFARSLLLALVATVICLIIAFPVGYFLSRLRVNKQHIMLMLVMLPMFFLAMYQKNGQPAEKILRYYLQARFVRPKVRPYKTRNYYALLMKGDDTHDSVSEKE